MTPDSTPPSADGPREASLQEAQLREAQLREAQLREAQFTRKLVLAVLSTLQHKGILKAAEVDALLLAARRSADASIATSSVPAAPAAPEAAAPLAEEPAAVPGAPAPAQARPLSFQVRAEPPREIVLHTGPLTVQTTVDAAQGGAAADDSPASRADSGQSAAEAVPTESAAAAFPADQGPAAPGTPDPSPPAAGKRARKDGPDAKAPPIIDIQID